MIIYIVSQNAEFQDALAAELQNRLDGSEIRQCTDYRQIVSGQSIPTGCLILWDYNSCQDARELSAQLEENKWLYSLLIFSREGSADLYRTGMDVRAAGVVLAGDDLSRFLKNAEDDLRQKRIVDMKLRTFRQLRFAVVGGVLRGYLMHSPNEIDIKMLQELKMLPVYKKKLWLVDIHVTNRVAHPEMERTIISTSIGNIAKEVMQPSNEMVSMAWMDDDIFVMFLQNRGETELDTGAVLDYLGAVRKYLEEYLDWHVNMYVGRAAKLEEAPALWTELENYRKENISLFPGIFDLEERVVATSDTIVSGIQNLRKLLLEGYADLLELEGKRYLMSLMHSKQASRKTLQMFYQEYLKLVYSVMWEKNWNAAELFQTDTEIEILNNAANNVATMERFMRHVSEYFSRRQSERSTKNAVQIVCRYITDHYAEPLMRDDLAEYIHMNPDYLTRIFRKETGMTLKDYIVKKRMEAAQVLLHSTAFRINEIAEMVGYNNYSYFTQNYRAEYGITPKQERDQHSKEK